MMHFLVRMCLVALLVSVMVLELAGCGDEKPVPVDIAFVHSIPAGDEYAAQDQFFLMLLKQGGLPEQSRVAFYCTNGDKQKDCDAKERDTAVASYKAIATQSGRDGLSVTASVNKGRVWLLSLPKTTTMHRRILVLITPERAWDRSGTRHENEEYARLLHYDWAGARTGLIQVFIIGASETDQSCIKQQWMGRFNIAPRFYDLEHGLSYSDFDFARPKHN